MNPFYLTAVQSSLCLGPMAMGIYITMKVFKIPDITTDGSYTLGAAVTAVLLNFGFPAWVSLPGSLLLSVLAGAVAGSTTGIIHTKWKVDALLAGILVMTALYSVNLIILGRSNVPMINVVSVFSFISLFSDPYINSLVIAIGLVLLLVALLTFLLKTDFGIAMRATGNNPIMTRAMGVNNDRIKIIGLAVANACTALSGSLMAQFNHGADISMGIGIVITGLGSVLMADSMGRWFRVHRIVAMIGLVIVGSLLFQLVLAYTLTIGIDPNLLKLVTALFVLLFVGLPRLARKKAERE